MEIQKKPQSRLRKLADISNEDINFAIKNYIVEIVSIAILLVLSIISFTPLNDAIQPFCRVLAYLSFFPPIFGCIGHMIRLFYKTGVVEGILSIEIIYPIILGIAISACMGNCMAIKDGNFGTFVMVSAMNTAITFNGDIFFMGDEHSAKIVGVLYEVLLYLLTRSNDYPSLRFLKHFHIFGALFVCYTFFQRNGKKRKTTKSNRGPISITAGLVVPIFMYAFALNQDKLPKGGLVTAT